VIGILLLAFLFRASVVIITRHTYRPLTDAADFDRIAQSIAHGHGFGNAIVPLVKGPSAFRAPLYPTVLAGVYAVFGHSYTLGRLENAVIGVLVVAMIGLLAWQFWGRRAGLVALALAAVHPTLVLFGTSLQLEPILMLLSLGALSAAVEYRRSDRQIRWLAVSGLLIGLAMLTREIGIALIPAVAALVLTADRHGLRDRRTWTRRSVAASFGTVLLGIAVVAPWSIRNDLRLHAFVPLTTSTGMALAGTYNQTTYANKANPALWIPAYQDPGMSRLVLAHPHPTEAGADREYRKAAVDFAEKHPAYVPKVLAWSTIRLFDLRGTQDATFVAKFIPYPRSLTVISVLASYCVEALAIAGLFLADTWRAPRAIWLFPLFAVLTIILLAGNIRYRASIEPFSVLLAGVTLALLGERLRLFARPVSPGGRNPVVLLE
jgi:4-amino-4-deoxy-L-arabinose transferase-like glycosyltransferase